MSSRENGVGSALPTVRKEGRTANGERRMEPYPPYLPICGPELLNSRTAKWPDGRFLHAQASPTPSRFIRSRRTGTRRVPKKPGIRKRAISMKGMKGLA